MGKNIGMGCPFLLQRIFLTQGLNPCLFCLLNCQAGSLPLVPPGEIQQAETPQMSRLSRKPLPPQSFCLWRRQESDILFLNWSVLAIKDTDKVPEHRLRQELPPQGQAPGRRRQVCSVLIWTGEARESRALPHRNWENHLGTGFTLYCQPAHQCFLAKELSPGQGLAPDVAAQTGTGCCQIFGLF